MTATGWAWLTMALVLALLAALTVGCQPGNRPGSPVAVQLPPEVRR